MRPRFLIAAHWRTQSRPAGAFSSLDLVTLVKAIDARDIARRILQIIRQIYDFGLDHGILDQNLFNPLAGINEACPPKCLLHWPGSDKTSGDTSSKVEERRGCESVIGCPSGSHLY
jgi:hypothetical protein